MTSSRGSRAPGDNNRLAVARRLLERSGIDVMTPDGRLEAARHLEALRERMVREVQQLRRDTASEKGTDDSGSSLAPT